MTDLNLIRRRPESSEPDSTVYKHYKGHFVRVLYTTASKDVSIDAADQRLVQYVSLTTGEILSRPLYSDTVDAWSDDILVDAENLVFAPRYAAMAAEPIPLLEPPPPVLVAEDVVRISMQLSTATMEVNPPGGLGWFTSVLRMRDVILPNLGTPEALRLQGVLAAVYREARSEGYVEADYRRFFAGIATDIAAEAGIVVG